MPATHRQTARAAPVSTTPGLRRQTPAAHRQASHTPAHLFGLDHARAPSPKASSTPANRPHACPPRASTTPVPFAERLRASAGHVPARLELDHVGPSPNASSTAYRPRPCRPPTSTTPTLLAEHQHRTGKPTTHLPVSSLDRDKPVGRPPTTGLHHASPSPNTTSTPTNRSGARWPPATTPGPLRRTPAAHRQGHVPAASGLYHSGALCRTPAAHRQATRLPASGRIREAARTAKRLALGVTPVDLGRAAARCGRGRRRPGDPGPVPATRS
jgi:hypothetical protein